MPDAVGEPLRAQEGLPGVAPPGNGVSRSEAFPASEEALAISLVADPMPMPRARARIAGSPPKQWVSMYTPKEADEHKAAIRRTWEIAGHPTFAAGSRLAILCVFAFARPAGHFGTGRNAALLKPRFIDARPGIGSNRNAEGQRTGGDIDNLVKLVTDALNETAYEDDAAIAELHAEKWYVDQLGFVAPRTDIWIWTL